MNEEKGSVKEEERAKGPALREAAVTLVLLLLIFLVPVASLLRGSRGGESDGLFAEEKTASGPLTPVGKLRAATGEFTAHLFLKAELIRLNRSVVSRTSGGTMLASTQVLAGKDHWLFFKSETDGESIADYMGTNRYSEEKMAQLTEQFEIFHGKLKDRGISLYVLCIPNKEIVYQEYMPDNYIRLFTPSRGEQLTEYVNTHSDIPMIYPLNALLDAKQYGQLYYCTDTHYNHIGAFVVLQEFFREAYGESRTPDTVQFLDPWDDYAGDLATVAGLDSDFHYCQDHVYTLNIETIDHSQYHDQCILIIGDSFADFLCAEAALYYREAYSVGVGAYDDSVLDLYHPDIVIWETGERRLSALE